MITSETPYKLAEIIRDTWPQLYAPKRKDDSKHQLCEDSSMEHK